MVRAFYNDAPVSLASLRGYSPANDYLSVERLSMGKGLRDGARLSSKEWRAGCASRHGAANETAPRPQRVVAEVLLLADVPASEPLSQRWNLPSSVPCPPSTLKMQRSAASVEGADREHSDFGQAI